MTTLVQVDSRAEWDAHHAGDIAAPSFTLSVEDTRLLVELCERPDGGVWSTDTESSALRNTGLWPVFERVAHELQYGRGLAVIAGFPVDEWSLDVIERAYRVVMSAFGPLEVQSSLGETVGYVENIGGRDTRERGYRNSVGLPLHTDLSRGLLGMLSVRTAATGGESRYASSVTVHNLFARERPDLLPILYDGFHFHRLDAALPGEISVTQERIPTFSVAGGWLTCRYARTLIDAAMEELDATHPPEALDALDLLDEITERPGVAVEFTVPPGHLVIANDYSTLHSRRAFDDHPGPRRGRLLLRTWARATPPRPRLPSVDLVPSFTRRPDGSTYYRGKSTRISG